MEASPAIYQDRKRMSRSFQDMAGYVPVSLNLVSEGEPERVDGASVTTELFRVLDRKPAIGRGFLPSDGRAGAPRTLVLSFGGVMPVVLEGQPDDGTQDLASRRFVTPGFFQTLGIPLRVGRDVAESDTLESPRVVVVSESFVRHFWPGQNPLGKRFRFSMDDRTVVGVVGDIRVRGLEIESEPLLAAGGVALGGALAYAAGRAMQALLVGISPADAATFSTAIALSLAVAALGSLLPALRAVRVDPLTVIRSE